MRKLIIMALLFMNVFLSDSIKGEIIQKVSICNNKNVCISYCYKEHRGCKQYCESSYSNKNTHDYWDCVNTCLDSRRRCFERCENDCE